MKQMKILFGGKSDNMKKLAEVFQNLDASPLICGANPLDIQMLYLTESPHAIIIEDSSMNYVELVKKLSSLKNNPQFYLLLDPFNIKLSHERLSGSNIHYIENKYKHMEIVNKVKFNSLGIYKSQEITQTSVNEHIEQLIHNALTELGITANYSGTGYLKKSLKALCLEELKCTDSMCKTIYPYVAKMYDVSSMSVERSIRTVIRKCWGNSSNSAHVKYFGFVFSDSNSIPTNREFIMILGDSLIREVDKFKVQMKVNMLQEL